MPNVKISDQLNMNIKYLKTDSDRQARIVISDHNWLEDEAVDQLRKTVELPGMRIGVGMPDLHPGKGQPIGATFITENVIYPHLVGSDIGCGMGLWQMDTPLRKVKLDKWEKQLVGLDDLWPGNAKQWLLEKNTITDEDSLLLHNNKLGTIGGGNHFAEFQCVNEVINQDLFEKIGIDKRYAVLLVHSGSRGLGQFILRDYIDNFGAKAIHYEGQEKIFESYLRRHDYAVKWAVRNRILIAERFCEQVKAKGKCVLDIIHNMVEPLNNEQAMAMGLCPSSHQNFWIHRKGASPTDKGYVMIPGSRGSLSYLVKPRATSVTRLAEGGFSLAHGAGRKWKRSAVRGRLNRHYQVKDLERTSFGSRVVCKQRDLLYEEAPQAYKNISQVISDLVDAGMVDIVATFKPLLTYKTRRK